MENTNLEVEHETIIKKEKLIKLSEKNKLKLKNIKQNKNKSANSKSKFALFFSRLFSFFFPIGTSFLSYSYSREKRSENKIVLYKEEKQLKDVDINKNDSFEDKSLLRNDLNYKESKANSKKNYFF